MINIYVNAYSKKTETAVFGVFAFASIPRVDEVVFLNSNEVNETRMSVTSVTHFAGLGGDGMSPPSHVNINGEVIE